MISFKMTIDLFVGYSMGLSSSDDTDTVGTVYELLRNQLENEPDPLQRQDLPDSIETFSRLLVSCWQPRCAFNEKDSELIDCLIDSCADKLTQLQHMRELSYQVFDTSKRNGGSRFWRSMIKRRVTLTNPKCIAENCGGKNGPMREICKMQLCSRY